MQAVPAALDAERDVLGGLMMSPYLITQLLAEVQLRPEHFYLDRHQTIYAGMVLMYDLGVPVDEISVAAHLTEQGKLAAAGGRAYLAELAGSVGAVGHASHHAEIIIAQANWRAKLAGSRLQVDAALAQDEEAYEAARDAAEVDVLRRSRRYSPDRQADIGFHLIERGGAEAFGWPFERINQLTAGGMRRGEFVVLAGHTSHGKSVVCDQVLEACARRGSRVCLYINEMAVEERIARTLNRRTGVSYSRIIRGKVDAEDAKRLTAEFGRGLPYDIVDAAGLSANEIAHDIRRTRPDVAALDILHEIDYEDERDLSRIASTLARTAKQANCALLATAHLNEKRVASAKRPRPTLGDIRGSGSVKNAADTVAFIHRNQDDDGEVRSDGNLYLAKVRNGQTGSMAVHFNPGRLRFEVSGE